ncbi:hypothetical protein GCM10023208_22430 [Erythrobacter westpacificensis]|uniref:UrcA family protein n=1 Tax=Erythrobacter westpacificensis TaxID=1055231 RepID=A0ABP9KEH8_9SPHN
MSRYLEVNMLRQLLTLLALISGLGLTATPAVAAQASVVSVAASGNVEDCQAVTTQPLQLVRAAQRAQRSQTPCKPKPVTVWTPTVQLQADRARE